MEILAHIDEGVGREEILDRIGKVPDLLVTVNNKLKNSISTNNNIGRYMIGNSNINRYNNNNSI